MPGQARDLGLLSVQDRQTFLARLNLTARDQRINTAYVSKAGDGQRRCRLVLSSLESDAAIIAQLKAIEGTQTPEEIAAIMEGKVPSDVFLVLRLHGESHLTRYAPIDGEGNAYLQENDAANAVRNFVIAANRLQRH